MLGWVFLVDHSWSVSSANQQDVTSFYNWFGSLQDWQRFYEGPPVDIMLKQCEIEEDSTIFEYGFGTGYLANELLIKYSKMNYIGVDISKTMYNLANDRLSQNENINNDRYKLNLAKDTLGVLKAIPNNSIDRFISNYVFDLLSKQAMTDIIDVLRLKLKRKGKICLTSLTNKIDKDKDLFASIILNGWNTISRFCPICLGGCRPIDLNYPFNVQTTLFEIIYEEIYIQYGLPSQILISSRREPKSTPKRKKK